ncbi:ABC transporter permease [Chitinophaga ginsengisegetis]|uniref:ABC transporter permease n=1 Tax=Chitinophaga ginsengisegetis TaxID=393003 RepID=UPI000DBA4131|nr:ABC transporter permease [Chitinophaga ginsengisegetis]MDR6570972.1 ABC-type antimicrobial peptide transport system permease subunit [Chitinophaga ginsengisegetis]MDR6650706.1 ABC-type antimicrobial peptide transport system permease subunit [Chitinophaga ginsengisegetis]MDR6657056.1 ABC-type antimicrobial peptide transport system permease subunit [Chitinophaga ginsengisegetis]
MLRNHTKVAWRNLLKNKTFSFINIVGLSTGMAVALLIGLWIHDELTFSKNHANYDRIVAVMQHQTFNGVVGTQTANPYLLGEEIRDKYGSDFKYVVMASWENKHVLAYNNNAVSKTGNYFEPDFPEMLTLKMLKGTRGGLKDPASILLSASTAKALFGEMDPIDKLVKMDNGTAVKVTGVYEDLPYNSAFRNLDFMAPWALYLSNQPWIREMENPWRSNFTQTYAQLADHADLEKVSAKIKDVKLRKVRAADAAFKPEVFLHPMSKWHLYADWENGKNIGGRIQFVWLFGIIGVFVLLLACINFMNLSTARSEKRAKEVGIRKAVGSLRGQLIMQFFSESLLLAAIGFVGALVLVQAGLHAFNDVADKKVSIPFGSPVFWLVGLAVTLFTGLIAGSYPALYLSSFEPVKVLKGTFRAGRYAAIPRKALVVTQFTVSVILIIGTIVVFRQIHFAKNRPTAYSREGLLLIPVSTSALKDHFELIRNELVASGAITEMSYSSAPTTDVDAINNGYTWKGMAPGAQGNFGAVSVTHDFGKTINWQIISGRDFSRDFASDTTAMILNESAVKFMGLKDPIGEIVKKDGQPFTVIGVIKDMVMQSPYKPVFRTVFTLDYNAANIINARINPAKQTADALARIEDVFKKYNPGIPFVYRFVDDEYATKFDAEQRIAKLSSFFAVLAIFISCLGLFGMASFMAEQRVKEIGVRKVMGASVFNLWRLMTKDFILLVVIALVIAVPVACYFMNSWLQRYEYRTEISWWIIVAASVGALLIALLTVSYQSVKAALMNPVKSLRSE